VVAVAFFPGVVAILGAALVTNRSVERIAPLVLVSVAFGLALIARKTAFAWRSLVTGIAVLILVVPIRRESQDSSLPFALEPYRVVLALLIAVWVAALLVDPKVRFRHSFLDWPVLAVLGATVASVVVNRHRILELEVDSVVTKSLVFLFGFFLFFWVIVSVVRRLADVEFVVRGLVLAGAFITIFALVEARTGFSIFDLLVRALPGSGRSTAPDPTIVLPTRGGRFRIFGSAQHPIELSAIMAMLVPLGLYVAYTTRRAFWWLVLALLLVGALVSLSRTGVIMLVVVVGVFAWLRPVQTIRLWPLLPPTIVLVHFMAPGVLRELLSSFFPTGGLAAQQQEATVGSGRLSSLGPALDVVAQHPLLGGGYGTRIPLGPNANSFIVDDMWLSLGMEVGIVGVAVWLWLFVRFIRRSSRVAKEDDSRRGWLMTAVTAAVLAYAIGMLTFDTLSFIQVTFLLVIVLALGTSQIERGSNTHPRQLAAQR
jgi:polysaccharide biosynthesis protein PslJ